MTLTKFTLLVLLLPALLWAEESLTVRQAMRDATANHPLLRAAEARAQSAHAQARQARGYRLPSIDLSESFVRTSNPAEAFAFQMNQERFNMSEFGNPANDPNNPNLLNTYMTRAEATLPVFTGGMLHARTLQATRMARAADSDLTRTRETVALDAATAWLNLSKAREYRDLMQRSLATAEAHQKRAQEYFNQGMLAPSDILRAEVFVAEIREYAARSEEQENLAQAALNFQRGRPQDESVLLAEQDSVSEYHVDTAIAVELAQDLRPDLRAAHDKLAAGQAEIAVARSTFLPQIGVVAHYDWYDDQLFGDHGESWAIMGQAKLNLFHGGADRNAEESLSRRTSRRT
ncbi:MAG: TolC family protein [bacterium]|nr:TolC family protein [bacterium]